MNDSPNNADKLDHAAYRELEIAERRIGGSSPCFLMAEVGQAHDGSLGIAHSYVDFVADAGFDAIKFQTHIAAEESTLDEPFRVNFSWEDKTRYDYWKRMEFTPEQWAGLKDHALDKGLVFLSTPFSVAAVDLLEDIGVPGWKIGSGDIGSTDILERVLATKKPVICSTGLSWWKEIDELVKRFKQSDSSLALMQATSQYPTSLDQIAIPQMTKMSERYQVPTGLSDHSGRIWPSLYALTMGAHVIEVHVTVDREMFGPDSLCSLTPDELKLIREGRDAFLLLAADQRDKDEMLPGLSETKNMFGRSAATRKPMKSGELFTSDDAVFKKPGGGITPKEIDQFFGKKLSRDVYPDRILKPDDFS